MKIIRKLRHDLVKEGKFRRYLIYGVGEILLVMISILLAFKVNNWNDRRNNKKTEIQYYQNIKSQLYEDLDLISSNIIYNDHYLEQFDYATQIIEANDRSKIDTLTAITLNLTEYSDFYRNSNIYETIVNSGEIKLLTNRKIIEGLQRLEETYVYINKMEGVHFELIKLYILPDIFKNVKIISAEVENPDKLFEFEFQNKFVIAMAVMKEKGEIYTRALNEIKELIELIDKELDSNR